MQRQVICLDTDEASNNASKAVETEAPSQTANMGRTKPQRKDAITSFLEDPNINVLKKAKSGKLTSISTLETIPSLEISPCSNKRIGKGLFAKEKIVKGRTIGAYFGKIILDPQAEDLEKLVQVNDNAWIQVSPECKLRSINHCCEPNAMLTLVKYHQILLPAVRSIKDIAIDDEITIDYGWVTTDDTKLNTPCLCDKPTCSRFLYGPTTRELGPVELETSHYVFYRSIEIYSPTERKYQRIEKGTWIERRPTKEELDYSTVPFIYRVMFIGRKLKPSAHKDRLVLCGQFFRRGEDEVITDKDKNVSPFELFATFCFEEVEANLFLNRISVTDRPNSRCYYTTGRYFSEDQEKILDIPPSDGYDAQKQEAHILKHGKYYEAPNELDKAAEEEKSSKQEKEPPAKKAGRPKNSETNNNNNNNNNSSSKSSSAKRKIPESPTEPAEAVKDHAAPLIARKKVKENAPTVPASPATQGSTPQQAHPLGSPLVVTPIPFSGVTSPPSGTFSSPQQMPVFPFNPSMFEVAQDAEFTKWLDDLTDLYAQWSRLDMANVSFMDLCHLESLLKRIQKKVSDAIRQKIPAQQNNNNANT